MIFGLTMSLGFVSVRGGAMFSSDLGSNISENTGMDLLLSNESLWDYHS